MVSPQTCDTRGGPSSSPPPPPSDATVSLPAQRYDYIIETLTPGSLTKNKQATVQIIAGYLANLIASKLSPADHHHKPPPTFITSLYLLKILQKFVKGWLVILFSFFKFILCLPIVRGGVEDTRLEVKTKDTKKIRGQGQGQPFRGQTLSRPRTGMLEAKTKGQGHKRTKKGLHKKFSGDLQKKEKKVFTKIFQAISTKKRFPKNFSSVPQNFNNSKNTAVLEPRTGQFSRNWGLEAKAKDFKMCPRGLHLCLLWIYYNWYSLRKYPQFFGFCPKN